MLDSRKKISALQEILITNMPKRPMVLTGTSNDRRFATSSFGSRAHQRSKQHHNHNMRCVLGALICIMLANCQALGQWTQADGPYGGLIRCFAVTGTSLFAGTDGRGAYLSTNSGTSWTAVNTGLTNKSVFALAVRGTNLVAGTFGGGVFLSSNNGSSWSAVNMGLTNYSVRSLAVSGTNLFAGTDDGGVFLSTNNGTIWNAVNVGLTAPSVYCLAVNGAGVFAGTRSQGVFYSSNNGTSWSEANTGLTNYSVRSLAVSGTNLFAGTYDGGVFLSTNNGANWVAVGSGMGSKSVVSLAVSGAHLFAGTYDSGVYFSTDNGANWTVTNTGLTNKSIYSLVVSSTNLFAGTYGSGVFLSTNSGADWKAMSTGMAASSVFALAVSGSNLFAGTYAAGVFLSSNNGTSWTTVNTGLTSYIVLSLAVSGPNLFAGTYDGGVFLSTNNGASWSAANAGLTNKIILSLAVNGANLFAGTQGGGAFLSSNSGASWTVVDTGLATSIVYTLAAGGANLYAGTNSGIYRCTYNGAGWTVMNTGMGGDSIHSLAVSGLNLFAGTNRGVYLSSNFGASWTTVNVGLTNPSVTSLAVSGLNLFAATYGGGVFLSTNDGASWTDVNAQLQFKEVHSLIASDTYLFAGSDGAGIWRRPLSEMIPGSTTLVTEWVSVPAGIYTFGQGDTVKTLPHNFEIMKYEVTNAQYKRYLREALATGEITILSGTMVQGLYPGDSQWSAGTSTFYRLGSNTSSNKFGQIDYSGGNFILTPDDSYADHPVVCVTWYGAWAFAKHYGLRLPTEEEWEKSARGSTGYDYPWGNSIAPGDANYFGSGDPFSDGTTPVGYYNGLKYGDFQTTNRPSPYGVYDMAGNAWEWTDSFYGGSYPAPRVFRGGSWGDVALNAQSWYRGSDYPMNGYYGNGFRCAKTVPTSVHSSSEDVVSEFSLSQNYPNPFNPSTTIRYGLPTISHVKLTVFNILGQQVAVLQNAVQEAGYHEVKFDATGLSSGVYLYRIDARGFVATKRLLLLR